MSSIFGMKVMSFYIVSRILDCMKCTLTRDKTAEQFNWFTEFDHHIYSLRMLSSWSFAEKTSVMQSLCTSRRNVLCEMYLKTKILLGVWEGYSEGIGVG